MVLIVLVGLPVEGTLCAALCNAHLTIPVHDHSVVHHHHLPSAAPDAPLGSRPTMLDTVARHDCGSHTGTGQDATAAVARADGDMVSAALDVTVTHVVIDPILTRVVGPTASPATTPPTRTPLVLRV